MLLARGHHARPGGLLHDHLTPLVVGQHVGVLHLAERVQDVPLEPDVPQQPQVMAVPPRDPHEIGGVIEGQLCDRHAVRRREDTLVAELKPEAGRLVGVLFAGVLSRQVAAQKKDQPTHPPEVRVLDKHGVAGADHVVLLKQLYLMTHDRKN